MYQVLVEVLPNILACNMYIKVPDNAGRCWNMLVSQSECIIELQNGMEILIKIPRGTSLVPNRIRGVIQEANIITARAQIDERTSLISVLSGDILSDTSTGCLNTQLSNAMEKSLVSAFCKQCQKPLCWNVKFRRVLPLPSVDWDQASEGWFCHLHADDSSKLKPPSLQPAPDECFYTELFFLIHNSMMGSLNAVCDGNDIHCFGCKMPFGVKTNQSVKIWTHSIVWLQEHGEIIFNRNESEIMLSLFRNIDRDNFGVNCRIVLQVSTVPKKYLFMVTMNSNQKLLVSDASPFFTSETLLKGLNGQREGFHGDGAPAKRARMVDKKDVYLKKLYAVKLLYHVKEVEDIQTGEWFDDVHVHIIPCSNSFFQEVKSGLESSTRWLPESMRIIENMNVGYIVK
ncbi:E3 ubiquitin-protein ligase E3D-like [Panulirus ornatus]|uniref:E3 ubiquitin-protein ligase E3D-like n=1 Tax=Panulirus ornatus TaxID=150431 RepID=UPI003A88D2A1